MHFKAILGGGFIFDRFRKSFLFRAFTVAIFCSDSVLDVKNITITEFDKASD